MSTNGSAGLDGVARLSSLDDPLRRRLYDFVCEQREPVSRDQAAAAAGIGRSLAAYHLDKLAAAGLLATDYRRPAGRGGPGAGRPTKLYHRADRELSVSVPPRDYELLARLLCESAEHDPTGAVSDAVGAAAENAGREAAATTRSEPASSSKVPTVFAALRAYGYQPRTDTNGDIELRNCPFHRIAQGHPGTVCGLNLRLVQGLLDGAGEDPARAALKPQPGRCCVLIHGV